MEKPKDSWLKLYVVDMDFLSIYARKGIHFSCCPEVKLNDADRNLQAIQQWADKSIWTRP